RARALSNSRRPALALRRESGGWPRAINDLPTTGRTHRLMCKTSARRSAQTCEMNRSTTLACGDRRRRSIGVAQFLRLKLGMKRTKPTADDRPGAVPDIHTGATGVTYVMAPCGTQVSERLIIRCDERGGLWISIGTDRHREQ